MDIESRDVVEDVGDSETDEAALRVNGTLTVKGADEEGVRVLATLKETTGVNVAAIIELEVVGVTALELLVVSDVAADTVFRLVSVADSETVPVCESITVLAGDDDGLDDSDFTDRTLANEDAVAVIEAVTGMEYRADAEPLKADEAVRELDITEDNVGLLDATIGACEIADDTEASHDPVAEIVTSDEGEIKDVADARTEGVEALVKVRVAVREVEGVSLPRATEEETTEDGVTELDTHDGADADGLGEL